MSDGAFGYGEMLAAGSAIAWAIGVILFRVAGRRVHPIALNLFKNSFALILYVPTMWLAGESLLYDAPTRDYLLLLLSGVLGMGLSDTFLLMALNRLGAGLTAIITLPYTPLVIALSAIYLGERLTGPQLLGVLAILVSLALVTGLRRPPKGLARRDLLIGGLHAVIAMLAMGSSIVMVKPILDRSPLIWATGWRLLGGLLFLGTVLAIRRDRTRVLAGLRDPMAWRSMIPGSLSGTYLALLLMLGGIKHTLASTATALNQTANLFIFLMGVLLLGEPATVRRSLGLLVGLAGAMAVILGG